ncbi:MULTISPECIES: TVP38/TMEM64 family protein [Bacillus]|uniref:TVP38/TMEM64 family protein n=1 Tax=Bacillus infantis TaxID=324767 RepID=A0A5D4SW32_9BACI|nr:MULTISPECIES: VTT domain-containing protein [Bacillus]MDT0161820.1 VTT domain-containing protein [Bacillus sp. AG4(2022)]TYS66076.1 TVP38/TMEM64 family protein [Bacillus infantis]
MNEMLSLILAAVHTGGWLSPVLFILLHTIRLFLFVPAAAVCIAGGAAFGMVPGTAYSAAGLLLGNMLFYWLLEKMPAARSKLTSLKKRWFGEYRNLTAGQVAVLRLIPFVHYHLLTFCLLERYKRFGEFVKGSWLTNLPMAVCYTMFGGFISRFSLPAALAILLVLGVLVYILREKMSVIQWRDFFKETA